MVPTSQPGCSKVDRILERARWAPSGDNEQCWRFEKISESHVVVHGYDTREHCVYDLDGSASQIGLGALIETMAIAASSLGLRIDVHRILESPISRPRFDVRFLEAQDSNVDPLAAFIETRSVNRRALSTKPLSDTSRAALMASVGDDHSLVLFEGARARRRMASLLFISAKIRLITPEAYAVHREAIAWGTKFSDDRVPDAAVGLDPMTAALMRWVMKSWGRVRFFNRFFAGTLVPRLQLDVIPALACAAHFILIAKHRPTTIDDFVASGRAMQRLWLTATASGLQMQPQLTPLIFARYARDRVRFTNDSEALELATRVARRLTANVGEVDAVNAVFMGRVGSGKAADARSLRLSIEQLMFDPSKPPEIRHSRSS